MHLGSLTRPELIFPKLTASDRQSVLRAMSESIAAAHAVDNSDQLYERLSERELLGSTGIGGGVAIPHCKLGSLKRVVLAIGIASAGVEFDAADGQPVKLFFLVASPDNNPTEHLKTLAAISKWVKEGTHVDRVLQLDEPAEIFALLDEVTPA